MDEGISGEGRESVSIPADAPEVRAIEPLSEPVREPFTTVRRDGPPASEGISPHPAVIAIAALAIGLGGGYLLFGQTSTSVRIPNTAPASYGQDTAVMKFGNLAANRLKSLEEWDAFDPFANGFPVPPDSYVPPLVPPGPPIPALPLASNVPVAPSPDQLRDMPPTLSGPMPSGGNVPLPVLPPGEVGVAPVPGNGEGTLPAGPSGGIEQTGQPRLVLASVSGVDMSKAQGATASIAGRFGGTARTFSHMTDEGAIDAEGVLLLVPSSKADGALAAVKGLGASQIDEDSNLGGADRQSRLRSIFTSRLAALRRRREELLVQFLPEADPVKDIDAAIDKEARALAAMTLPSSANRMTAIRILLRE